MARQLVEDFVMKGQNTPFQQIIGCHGDCDVGKLLHSEEGKYLKDVSLLNCLCASCTNFCEVASQAVLLTKIGDVRAAQKLLESNSLYTESSMTFQVCLRVLMQRSACN
ncbi:MAG: hypothetical protein ABII63_05280 [Pseudomonadota bacterium]